MALPSSPITRFSRPLREDAVMAVKTETDGDIDTFLTHVMPRFPRLSVWSIATAVAEEYGADTDNAVYRLIEDRLGLPHISVTQRKPLNDLFRFRCGMLGLTLPRDNTRLIDDYLFQAGIPYSQIVNLVKLFLHAEREHGSPSVDDTSSLSLWEHRAATGAATHRASLNGVLAEDTTGYHAAAYFRLRESGDAKNDFERRVLSAIQHARHEQGSTVLFPPYLTFGDGELSIEVPARGKSLEVEIGTRTIRIDPGVSRVLLPPWPREVRWRARPQASSWGSLHLFKVPTADILVFDGESGRQKESLRLGLGEQRVPGGSIVLVSTQPFLANGDEAYRLGDEAYVLFRDVTTALRIEQGENGLVARGDPRPRLDVDGVRDRAPCRWVVDCQPWQRVSAGCCQRSEGSHADPGLAPEHDRKRTDSG